MDFYLASNLVGPTCVVAQTLNTISDIEVPAQLHKGSRHVRAGEVLNSVTLRFSLVYHC